MIKNRKLAGTGYGTHITPLIAAVMSTYSNVIEMGMGDYSTPLLHEIIKSEIYHGKDRRLISVESDLAWAKNFEDLKTPWHELLHINDWKDFEFPDDISVMFIDHAPAERRIVDIEKFKNRVSVIVVHDTEKTNYYGYERILSKFKYRFEYERYSKRTTLLSNTIDVTKIL